MVQIQADTLRARALRKKRSILLAAAEEFRARGFHATGMRDIAKRLGMTVGNLYYYFKNKDAILSFCQEDTLKRLLELVAAVRASGEPADRQLHRLIAGHVECLNVGTPGSLAHLEVAPGRTAAAKRILAMRDRYERALREVITEGIDAGDFLVEDPKTAVMAILGAVNWTVRWFRPDGGRSAAAVGAEFASYLLRGLYSLRRIQDRSIASKRRNPTSGKPKSRERAPNEAAANAAAYRAPNGRKHGR